MVSVIAMTISSLALLAATGAFYLTLREKKRNQKRNAAVTDYVEQVEKDVRRCLSDVAEELKMALLKTDSRLGSLENGLAPDYEKAKAAASAVNDFNAGLSALLGYDPYEALKAAREKESGGVSE